jgi:Na+/H+-dicarboxylate symporter
MASEQETHHPIGTSTEKSTAIAETLFRTITFSIGEQLYAIDILYIRDIVLPIGATAHMDGTVFSTILKISFLFGIYGIPFTSPETIITALFLSLAGGVVMSGVPGGGLIGEMFIVSMYGFPPEAFPIIATIGYLVDPPATMINATGDTVASMLVTRILEGKNWIKNKLS